MCAPNGELSFDMCGDYGAGKCRDHHERDDKVLRFSVLEYTLILNVTRSKDAALRDDGL